MSRKRRMFVGAALLGGACLVGMVITRVKPEPPRPIEGTAERRARAMRQALFDQLEPVTLRNCEMQRFGEADDGGYVLCKNLLGGVEAGYSYGIAGYDGWGCDVSTRLNVPLHRYDCFDTRQPACAGATTFHAECIGPTSAVVDGRRFDTLERQIGANGHGSARLVVKIDVEGAEWDALLDTSDAVLERIDQMAVEFHGVGDAKHVVVLQRLREFFYVANLHINNFTCTPGLEPFPGWAYEVLFVAKRLAEVDPSARRQPFHPLDARNSQELPDCQVTR